MSTTALERYAAHLVNQFGTYQALADAVGMSLSAFLRGVKAGRLSVENLLVLAEVAGESPSKLLRMGGHEDTADRLERLYGAPAKPLSSLDRSLVGLDQDAKRSIVSLLREVKR